MAYGHTPAASMLPRLCVTLQIFGGQLRPKTPFEDLVRGGSRGALHFCPWVTDGTDF